MGCLDCSFIRFSEHKLTCQKGLSIDVTEINYPDTCSKAQREDNYFGKTYGMKKMILLILSLIGKSLSKEEIIQIQEQTNMTNQLLFVIDLYERKIESLDIEKPEVKNLSQGKTCYHCIHSSSTEDYLFIRCSYYQNDIGEDLNSCPTIESKWCQYDAMIRRIGLNHFFSLLLQYNSSLWLYINEDATAGDKWIAIVNTYEETLKKKSYQVKKLHRNIKTFDNNIDTRLEPIKDNEKTNPPEVLEDGIVY